MDLAIDNNGDLIFGGNRDLLTVDGQEQVEQRIRMRLLLPQGTFIHDTEEMVGSDLAGPELGSLLRRLPTDDRVYDDLALRVQEALAPMEDIQVSDVKMTVEENRSVTVEVLYTMRPEFFEDAESIGQPTLSPDDLEMSITLTTNEEEQ